MVTSFAQTNFRGKQEVFGIKEDDRRRHVYIIGKTGMGKTNMLKTMMIQDIINGNGLAYVDPHGDTAESLLNYIPKQRINDVVYFNPADVDYPVAFNVLENVNEEHKHLIASGLMGVFKKIWPDVWSPRMEHILNYTILALLDYPAATMLGINRMLSDKQFRNKVLNKVKDPIVKSFWTSEFARWNDKYMNEAIAPIQNKVGQFIATPIIRNIVSQTKSTIDMRRIMDEGKILIINLSKGRIGDEAMHLLGGIMVTKLQLSAMERVDIPEGERKDFYLFVDEFQNFVNENFANILSEARKYRLNLTLAHQYIGQLINDGSPRMKDAIFGNVGTMVSFRIGAEDAEYLAKEFEPEVMAYDLVNLAKYEIYLKLMIDGIAGNAFSAQTLPPLSPPVDANAADKVIRVSRERYGKDRRIIEDKIARWSEKNDLSSANKASKNKSQPNKKVANNNDLSDSKKAKFEANCDECAAKIKLSFKPDGIRKVYCPDCLKQKRKEKKLDYKKKINLDLQSEELGSLDIDQPADKLDLVGLKKFVRKARNS
ncbi:MAG: type IV secretion system DNA-binding domain-containing protein [Candidatus Moranbacteria bacterium]|nr:type IV secretion system DNA-binding domain-containing protein [Candidatus Moranbacteria bacterium]